MSFSVFAEHWQPDSETGCSFILSDEPLYLFKCLSIMKISTWVLVSIYVNFDIHYLNAERTVSEGWSIVVEMCSVDFLLLFMKL